MDARRFPAFLTGLVFTACVSTTTGLQCYTCVDTAFGSTNPMVDGIFKAISAGCDLTPDKLVTCPSPASGGVAKCSTSTTRMTGTARGFDFHAVVTDRRCMEATSGQADGCEDGGSGTEGVTLPSSLRDADLKSLTITNCRCAGDRCNDRDISLLPSTVPSLSVVTSTTRPTQQAETKCYTCSDLTIWSTSEKVIDALRNKEVKCSFTQGQTMTCPTPVPGNAAKCATHTTQFTTVIEGMRVQGALSDRSCSERPADEGDLCKVLPASRSTQSSLILPGLTMPLDPVDIKECYCSGDICNDKKATQPSGQSPLKSGMVISAISLIFAKVNGQ